MKNRMTKSDYDEQKRELKQNLERDLNRLKKKYKNSGFNCDDILNSMYVRGIYYKPTLKNIKRDGLFRFLFEKLRAERKYRYAKARGISAKLECPGWSCRQSIAEEPIDFDYSNVVKALYLAEAELSKELKKKLEKKYKEESDKGNGKEKC